MVLFLTIVAGISIYGAYTATHPPVVQGAKTITVDIVHGDGTKITAELHTDQEYLGKALVETEDLVTGEEGPYGLFIKTADGESASDADKTFWAVYQDGVSSATGVDLIPIADGEHYSLELTKY